MSLPLSTNATITMSIQDYQTIEKLVEELRAQVATFQQAAPAPFSDEADPILVAALNVALPIVQFAVGNLNPESVKGWPYQHVDQLGKHVAHLYEGDAEHETLAITLRAFAREARELEEFRQRREQAALEVLSAPTVAPEGESATDDA